MPKSLYTTQFRRDVKRIQKAGSKDLEKLKTVVRMLVDGKPLESKYVDHPTGGNLKGHRDCHIEADWILPYRIDKDRQEIVFVRTGSHSELFG
ncbi:MAG: type II toxin-antitoxin system YafQ family toxin [Desulfobacteraceae bacterium]|nr:type II toxin-antitoxin system YafQ family toxin [Desulfobacteraceae bacterium]